MLKITIIDDERQDIERLLLVLRKYKAEVQLEMSIDTYRSGEQFLSEFCNQYDVIFMDVEMDTYDGIKTAKQIRKTDMSVPIIYTTYHSNYAYDSYAVSATDYLLKPINYESVKKAMKKALTVLPMKKNLITLSQQGQAFNLSIYDILYIEYDNRRLSIVLVTGETKEVKGTLKSIISQDQNNVLIKINKYQLVNRKWIYKCEEGKIFLRDGSSYLYVSRERWKMTKEIYLHELHLRNR